MGILWYLLRMAWYRAWLLLWHPFGGRVWWLPYHIACWAVRPDEWTRDVPGNGREEPF